MEIFFFMFHKTWNIEASSCKKFAAQFITRHPSQRLFFISQKFTFTVQEKNKNLSVGNKKVKKFRLVRNERPLKNNDKDFFHCLPEEVKTTKRNGKLKKKIRGSFFAFSFWFEDWEEDSKKLSYIKGEKIIWNAQAGLNEKGQKTYD